MLIQKGLPPTACSILSVFVSSLWGGCCVLVLEHFLKDYLDVTSAAATYVASSPVSASFANVAMCFASKRGYYHKLALPLILLEMQHGDFSFTGASDFLSLCCVGAGVCFAVCLKSPNSHASRGFLNNLGFGDFVEAAYPYMEESPWVNFGAYLGSFLSGWVLSASMESETSVCLSSAYLPAPLSILFSNCPRAMFLASVVAFTIPFLTTLAAR
jgi:hypothetical protein